MKTLQRSSEFVLLFRLRSQVIPRHLQKRARKVLLGNLLAAGVWIYLSSVQQSRFLMIAGGYTTQHVILNIYIYIIHIIYNILCNISIIRFLPRSRTGRIAIFLWLFHGSHPPRGRQCSSTAFPSSVCPEMWPQVLVGDCLGIVEMGGGRRFQVG